MDQKKRAMKVVSIRLTDELYQAAVVAAKETNYSSTNAFICHAISELVKRVEKSTLDKQTKQYYDTAPAGEI